MNIKITKADLEYCTICGEPNKMKKQWDEEQKQRVDDGEQEEAIEFPGAPGYIVDDADDDGHYSYSLKSTYICETCMKTIMRGVKIITEQDLLGISVKAE